MHPAGRYLTVCAAVLVTSLAASHPGTRINDPDLDPGLHHDVIPVTSQPLNRRIVEGNDATNGSHPYIAALQINWNTLCDVDNKTDAGQASCESKEKKYTGGIPSVSKHLCGGTLIHESWVLTAAHCVKFFPRDPEAFKALKIVLGQHERNLTSLTGDEQIREVKDIIMHPDYTPTSKYHDIALIELSAPVNLCITKSIKIAKLSRNDSAYVDTRCIVAGWGRLSAPRGRSPIVLQEVKMHVISNYKCEEVWQEVYFKHYFKKYINKFTYEKVLKDLNRWMKAVGLVKPHKIRDGQVCILDQTPDRRSSVCQGDSGGPLMCGFDDKVLVGVTSYVKTGCDGDVPQVTTRVSQYIGFIEREAKIKLL